MSKGVLVLNHGSRSEDAHSIMETIFNYVKDKFQNMPMQLASMEFGEIDMEKGLDILVEKGVNNIIVVPYFLFNGMHIKVDIPNKIEEYTKKYPNVTVKMGETLGADYRMGDVLIDRIKSAL